MSSEYAIEVDGLNKCYQIYDQPSDRLKQMLMRGRKQYYKEFWALKDVSLKIKSGETVGIIGRNGSGKSTLLQIICGTLSPTSGSIQTDGRIAALLELGSGFNSEFTGRENVYMNASILGLSSAEIDRKYDEIIAFADIGDFINQPIKTYSSGMVIRLAFAVAISVEPRILVVDEALSVGDFVFQQKCFERIRELQNSGSSILLVSHDLASIVQFCNSAYVMKNGEILFQGNAKDAAGFYKKLYSSHDNTPIQINKPLVSKPDSTLKINYKSPSNAQTYGSGLAQIYDWAILDSERNVSTAFYSDRPCTIVVRIQFLHDCTNPIAGYFFTDAQGREIVGTNTEYLKTPIGKRVAGDKIEVRFEQILGISSGEYSLNLGCSEYIEGALVAHHRLYDLYVFSIHRSSRNVGFCLPPTNLSIALVT